MEILRYYSDESIFRDALGNLKEEPEENIEELERMYAEASNAYSELTSRLAKAKEKITVRRWINNVKPTFYEDDKPGYASRTIKNAEWADITLAIAVEPDSPGEKTTRRAAKGRIVEVVLPETEEEMLSHAFIKDAVSKIEVAVKRLVPEWETEGIYLNIAGSGLPALSRHGLSQSSVTLFTNRLVSLLMERVTINEICSGGQTGLDEAGIKAAQYNGIQCNILAPQGFKMRLEDGTDVTGFGRFSDRFKEDFVDWDKADEETTMLSMGEFNLSNGIEMLEWKIDLKLLHMHYREKDK